MTTHPLAEALIKGDRRALARAITLVESGRADHRKEAMELLDAVRDPTREALRIGLSGTPGVGKSTFIESFGMMLTQQGLRVAVLAVDPSSARSGGSILGDKTRMDRLARETNCVYSTKPQSNTPWGCGAPYERGSFPADIILVNKADGDLKATATRTCADYAGALRLLRKREGDPQGFPKALTVSALEENGLETAWEEMQTLAQWRRESGYWQTRRGTQGAILVRTRGQRGSARAPQARACKGGDAITGWRGRGGVVFTC
ncbi:Methylmalonic aciduria type A protein, mitochondrial [Nymphon striatum]|nr:Methylmalonic aciduria type A protein, mitochondrial [Nymphon striatum]